MYRLDILPLNKWLGHYELPFIVSGPCSAESEQQLLDTAKALANISNVKVFRAGIWKPRTHPKTFEGVGIKGLKWLKSVKKETGLLTAVEVATPKHVEECLRNKVDILWIGARTSVNPFSVQEICSVLKGTDIPVMVKNPVNPDVQLWLGALERINQAGIKKLIAIHRGFFSFKKNLYRNNPLWEIPVELKRLCPDLPVICDPSHICGNKELLLDVSQKALDTGMDGLMIESHINPDIALTDTKQQITPQQLSELIYKLKVHKALGNVNSEDKLKKLRNLIDKLDNELLNIVSERMKVSEKIGRYKNNNNIAIYQKQRWNKMIRNNLIIGNKFGLNKDFLSKFFALIHKESIQRQKNNKTEMKKI